MPTDYCLFENYRSIFKTPTRPQIKGFAITTWARCMDLLRSRCLQWNFVLTGNLKNKTLITKVWGSELTWTALLMNSSTLMMEEPNSTRVLPLAPKPRRYILDERCRYSQQNEKMTVMKMYGYHQCVRAKGLYWKLHSSTGKVCTLLYSSSNTTSLFCVDLITE
jgi:hypothetical protein